MPILQPGTVSSLNQRSITDLLPILFPEVECPIIPLGNRILVQVASPIDQTTGGVILPSEVQEFQKWSQKLAKVLKLANLAYRDRNTFEPWPEGPWCQEGDWIRIPQYGGDRVEITVPADKAKYPGHLALFCTIPDRDAWSKVPQDINPMTMRGWF